MRSEYLRQKKDEKFSYSMEDYEKVIDSFGLIQEVVKDKEILKIIVNSPYKFLLLCLVEKINYALINSELDEFDLSILRSDFLMNCVLELYDNIKKNKKRKYEVGDKIIYLSMIKDYETLYNNFFNSSLIYEIYKNFDDTELIQFITTGEIYLQWSKKLQNQFNELLTSYSPPYIKNKIRIRLNH